MTSSSLADRHAVYWPRAARTVPAQPVAPRLPSLEGRTVAFVWDHLFRGDLVFTRIQRELQARFPGVRFVGHESFGTTHGGEADATLSALPGKLRNLQVEALISGIGA